MAHRPHTGSGILEAEDEHWKIVLESAVPPGTAPGSHVQFVYWLDNERPSEYEAIGAMQQLSLDVIAHGLRAEGALHDGRAEFLQRLGLTHD